MCSWKTKAPSKTQPHRETFLDVVDLRLVLSLAADSPDVVTKAPISTNKHTHCAHLGLNLHSDKSVDVWSAGEHLNGGAWALDFFSVTGTGDEQHDTQNLSAAIHGQDAGHPRANPFEVFWGLNNPNESHAPCRNGALCISLDQMAHKWYLVGDSDTTREQNNCTVGVHGMNTAIGSLGESSQRDLTVGRAQGPLEQLVSKAGSTTNQNELFRLAPTDGERVRRPPSNGRNVQIDVLARLEGPRTCHPQGDSHGVPWKGLHQGRSGFPATVPVEKDSKSRSSLKSPENDGNEQGRTFLGLGDSPSEDMGKRLTDDDPGKPAVDQVIGVEGYLEQFDQGIVSAGQQHERNQIHRGHGAGAVSDDPSNRILLFLVRNSHNTNGHVHGDNADQDKGMEATGQGAHVDSP
ncbi:unnamed protein product [Aspergillus oryzae var. brunneus]|uniref:Unnamed protein product n=2 Tax=Aspergillus oryzae TaxID=5062 RepID=A0AAN5BY98_ASPOZ|nr:unnamed protein product [Aspergillus oryzae]GMG49679.1 unnamed protein product [Aspergillus oryzae var. brunneus]